MKKFKKEKLISFFSTKTKFLRQTYFGVSNWSDTERSEGQMICRIVAIISDIIVGLLARLRTNTDMFFMKDARIAFCVLDF